MNKLTITCLLVTMSYVASAQQADTFAYKSMKLITSDKADKRPEPTFDLGDFVMNNIMYPNEAKEYGIQGIVYIKFTIDEKGKVNDAGIISSPDTILSKEVIRLVNTMPAWTPAVKDGQPVPFSYTMPISFKLEYATPRRRRK